MNRTTHQPHQAAKPRAAFEFKEENVKPKIKSDTFWGDLANALVLSPVRREPVRNDRPKCDSDIHEIPVQSTVTGWFRNYYQTNPESVRTNYCGRCADAGTQLGMFHADNA